MKRGSGNNSPKASPKSQANNSPKASPKSQNAPVKKNPESVLRKVLVRSVVGVSMIAFFAAILTTQYVNIILPLLAVILQILVYKEIIAVRYRAVKEKKLHLFRTLNWYFLGITLFYFYGRPFATILFQYKAISSAFYSAFNHYHLWTSFCLYVFGLNFSIIFFANRIKLTDNYTKGFCGFSFTLKPGMYKYQFAQIAWTALSLLLVVFQCASFVGNFENGIFWVVFPASMIITNDITAYFWGIGIGRKFVKSSLTSLSPNKTWEGFVGALFTTVLLSIPFCYWFMQYDRFICPQFEYATTGTCTPLPVWSPSEHYTPALLQLVGFDKSYTFPGIYIHAVLLAIFSSLIAPFGGFFASGMKRAHNIKDFDSIFPGHGGFYDRFDCQLMMTLCTFVHFRTFVQAAQMGSEQIMSAIAILSREEQLLVLNYLTRVLNN